MRYKKRNVEKLKKYFNPTASRVFISLVAIVETLLLIAFTTFSWIETSSSLEIKNGENGQGQSQHLHVSNALNYRVQYNTGTTGTCDLNTFFSNTYQFEFAKCSSANGYDFFFPRANSTNSSIGNYRAGDTTDYNTSYRALDFVFKNDTDDYAYYGFESNNFFTLTSNDLSSTLKEKGAKAYRFSIDINSAHNPKTYGMDDTSYAAVSATDGTSTTISANLVTPINNLQGSKAFTVHGNSSTSVRVNVWFDIKAASVNGLNDAQINQILASSVNVNIKFKKFAGKPENNGTQIRLVDRAGTFLNGSTPISPITLKDVKDTENGNDISNISMIWDSTNGYYKDDSAAGVDLDRYSLDEAYFYNSTTRQSYCITNPSVSSSYVTFTTLSKTSVSSGTTYTLGTWGSYTYVYFKLPTNCTYYSTAGYNDQASGVNYKISDTSKSIYVNLGGTNSERATATLTYDSENSRWRGEVPESFLSSNLNFYYNPTSNYYDTSNDNCKTISAPSPKATNSQYICETIGFSDTDNKQGFGVWEELSTMNLSLELMDMDVVSHDRYQLGIPISGGGKRYIYMQPTASQLGCFVYYPSSATDNFTFKRNSDEYDPHARITKNTCYLIHNAGSNVDLTISWNPVVLVDGTAEGLISQILAENKDSPSVAYSLDGGSSYTLLNQIDDYRWYAALSSNVNSVTLRWVAYASTNTLWETDVTDLSNGFIVTYTE